MTMGGEGGDRVQVLVGDLDEGNLPPRGGPSRPVGAVVAQQRESHVVDPLAPDELDAAGGAFVPEAEMLDHAHRRHVGRIDGCDDAVDVGLRKERIHHRTRSFAGEASAVVGRSKRETDLGDVATCRHSNGDVTDDLSVVLDCDLHPTLDGKVVEMGLLLEQLLG